MRGDYLLSGLVIVLGLIATGVGVTAAAHRLRTARRTFRKLETLYDAMPESWGSWFVGGFSSLTIGTHWLRAAMTLAAWAIAGLSLVWLGLQSFWRF